MLRLLLRPLASFAGPVPGAAMATLLARADRTTALPGWRAQLERAFSLVPTGLPVAALTRQLDCNDAELHQWLRADPAHVQADMATARLAACGEMGLDAAECAELLRPLKPVFGDAGFPISAPVPQRWYLMLPRDNRLPAFADPHDALGAPMDAHLPQGETGRRWRHLLNEAQVILHNHPLNQKRMRDGKLPVNSLWFWGGGSLPDDVRCVFGTVRSNDVLLRALAGRAGLDCVDSSAAPGAGGPAPLGDAADDGGSLLVDLRDVRDATVLERDWLAPALDARRDVQLDFGDGTLLAWRRPHRWRLWRRPRIDIA